MLSRNGDELAADPILSLCGEFPSVREGAKGGGGGGGGWNLGADGLSPPGLRRGLSKAILPGLRVALVETPDDEGAEGGGGGGGGVRRVVTSIEPLRNALENMPSEFPAEVGLLRGCVLIADGADGILGLFEA